MALLQILTRHHPNRPNMLRRNQESLVQMGQGPWEQTVIIDKEGGGVPRANRALAEVAPRVMGDYIWVLDDDDECVDAGFAENVRDIVREFDPDVMVFRCDLGERHGILPENEYWQKAPARGHIGMSNFVVRRDVYRAYADHFAVDRCADHNFIRAVWDAGCYRWYWADLVVMRTQQPEGALFGAPEPANVA